LQRTTPATPAPGADAGFRTLWQRFLAPGEWLFTLLAGSRPVPGSRGTFLIAYHRYRGTRVDLPDGTHVARGDLVAEIHFWNRRIATRTGGTAQAVTWGFIRDMRADIGALARAMQSGALTTAPVYGASPLAEAAARFGFLVRPLPRGWRRFALTTWQTVLRRTFRPRALHTESRAETAEIWMGPTDLLRRYGGRADAARGQDPGGGPRKGAIRDGAAARDPGPGAG